MRDYRDLLKVDLPVIQAPMAGVQDAALALAVSSAGGLGSLPCAMLDETSLCRELGTLESSTDKPINLNFFCHRPPTPDPERERKWRALLRPYYQEYGLDPEAVPEAPPRQPFSHEVADVLEEFRPAIVSFHYGLPEDDLLARVRGWGATILSSATTVEEACWLAARGVDAVIAQGYEAGGHRGMFLSDDLATQAGTFALLPQIVASVDVPVIAAGGIAGPEGLVAALSMGATAVQAGTAYLLCDETRTTPLHRKALRSDRARYTALTNLFSGRPARGIVNRVMSELGPIRNDVPDFPLAAQAITVLRQRAEAQGSADFSPLWSGQNVGGCREISAAELTRWLAEGL